MRVFARKTAVIVPFIGDGRTEGGLFVVYDEGYGAGKLAPILGRVIARSPDFEAALPGEVIAFHQNSPDEIPGTYGKYATIKEHQVAAVLDGFDQEYYVPEA
jgi:hypothetical protein